VALELPENETLKVLVYGEGKILAERSIAPTSNEHKKLASWLSFNHDGWSPTPASYVPGVYVTGNNFSINFLKSNVIVNFRGGQFIKPIDPKEYDFLL